MMLTTPKEKKKLENTEKVTEADDDQPRATTVVVEEMVNEMFKTVENVITLGTIDDNDEHNAEYKETENDSKPQSLKSSVDRSSDKMTTRETMEMIKALPPARQEEFKTCTQNQTKVKQAKSKKSSNATHKNTSVKSGKHRKPDKNPHT